ncbi:mRNA capping enzyme [Catovirus CTV1]|uniref:mRNA capping enzyme n=1 Tax=Catovirus CTV1 TaxID=1977631 RepID=A0A1V0SC30_9VIRU|nr:mRNA capping enzyme [Catovirus CTV1]
MSKQNNTLINLLNKDKESKQNLERIYELYNQVDVGKEFEFMMFNFNKRQLSLEKYISLIKYLTLKNKQKKMPIIKQNVMDIIFSPESGTNYRISIEGIDKINHNIEQLHGYKNHVLFRTYIVKILEGNKDMYIMKKIKDKENLVDLDDVNIRARLSQEIPPTKKELDELKELSHENEKKIIFRLKDRVSFFVLGNETSKEFIRVDLTITKMSKHIKNINDVVPNYELEIEYGVNEKVKKSDAIDIMFKEAELLLKVIQMSNYIVTNSREREVINEYAKIGGLDPEKIISLDGRQPLSLEIQHVTETLPNKYAVTDKADGDRYFLIIVNNHVYFISTNLNVKDSGIELPKELSKYNNSILDGELIFLPSKNKYLYMAFDCLFKGSDDIRKTEEFMERIKHVDEIINSCFVMKNHKGFVIKDYKSPSSEYNINDVVNFHNKQLTEFMTNLNSDLSAEKLYPLIRRKYFMAVSGAKPWEIYKFSAFLWDKYTNDAKIEYPYLLDGLIYHPLNQAYVTNAKESKLFEYKWKPPEKNSIDFYILFQRDKDTGKILTVYDNSVDDHVKNKPYKICNLYVGKKGSKYGEQPTLFREEQGGYIANLFLKDGEPVDIDNNLLNDNTVVEFYYKSDPELDERFQWVPIRTRYDKTESVIKHGRKYGNYIDVANKVWRSIINPILISDFEDLAKGNDEKSGVYYYDKKINSLRNKIGHDLIVSATKENVYFQVKTNLAVSMRQFHNWVKSIIIYTHCHPMYQNNKSLSVLDIACGKGQDIMKFYYSKVAFLVGLDVDRDALTSAIDGAISRYNKFQKSKPGFPKMHFIQADVGSLLNYGDQFRSLKGMSNENRNIFEKFFNEKNRTQFDRVNCQFAIHYFLKTKETWNNFKQNLKDYLKPGGYFLTTTYDAHRVVELFKDSDKYSVFYTNDKGDKKILFELIKKFPNFKENEVIGVSNPLDVHVAWFMQEGNYMTEYLVDKNFIEKELYDDCDLELVDTAMFDELFEMHREYFMKYAQYEENPETRNFLLNVKEYYNSKDDVNRGCYNNTRLTRYYVFRRKDAQFINKQKGGTLDFENTDMFVMPKITEEKSCCGSIHNILKIHKLIPNSITAKALFDDLNIEFLDDKKVDTEFLDKLSKSISIYHENEDSSKKKIFDGLNILVAEKNCNGEYDFDLYNKSPKPKKTDKYIILLKNDNVYKPVYRREGNNNSVRGIFPHNDTMIQRMIDNV